MKEHLFSEPMTPEQKRKALIRILRDHKLWPENFRWFYEDSETCAIGLAERCGLHNKGDELGPTFGLSGPTVSDIFYHAGGTYGKRTGWFGKIHIKFPPVFTVTPERVADLLEYVAKGYKLRPPRDPLVR